MPPTFITDAELADLLDTDPDLPALELAIARLPVDLLALRECLDGAWQDIAAGADPDDTRIEAVRQAAYDPEGITADFALDTCAALERAHVLVEAQGLERAIEAVRDRLHHAGLLALAKSRMTAEPEDAGWPRYALVYGAFEYLLDDSAAGRHWPEFLQEALSECVARRLPADPPGALPAPEAAQ